MFRDLAEIPAVDPALTGRTPDEMLGVILRLMADSLADVLQSPNPHVRAALAMERIA